MAWTQAAREAALAARRANAQGKQQPQPQPRTGRKPGPQVQHANPANRAAFALRNKMMHDAGAADRIHAAHQRALMAQIPHYGSGLAKALLGLVLGGAGTILHSALSRQGGRR